MNENMLVAPLLLADVSTTFTDFFSETENGYQFKAAENLEMAGSGLWYVLLLIGSFGLVFSLMFVALKIFLGGSQERAAAKSAIPGLLVLSVLLFGIPFVVGIIMTIAGGFN